MAPGWSLHDELRLLVGAGLTPYEALRAATANAGEFFAKHFHAGPSGTITPGARADLVLLDANPLDDIRNTRKVRGVVVRGRWMAVGTRSAQ
jgi:imidazolonepropionase-like amidohydrolase